MIYGLCLLFFSVVGYVFVSFRWCIAFAFTRRRGQVSDCFKTGYSDSERVSLQVENIIDEYVYYI